MMAGFYLTKLKEFIEKIGGVNSLALLSDLNIKTIYNYQSLKAKASVRSTQKIAKALGVTVDALGPVEVIENVPKIEKRPKEKKFFLKGLSAEKARSGLTYNELAERSGLPIGRIHRFAEQRQAATWREAQRIADFLGCPVESLRLTE